MYVLRDVCVQDVGCMYCVFGKGMDCQFEFFQLGVVVLLIDVLS